MKTTPLVLKTLQDIRIGMYSGKSVSQSIANATSDYSDPFRRSLKIWRLRIESGQEVGRVLSSLPDLTLTFTRRAFVSVLDRGLKGTPIDENLAELEREMFHIAEQNFERNLQLLPLKMMIPLVLMILPAVMLIIIGPLLFSVSQKF